MRSLRRSLSFSCGAADLLGVNVTAGFDLAATFAFFGGGPGGSGGFCLAPEGVVPLSAFWGNAGSSDLLTPLPGPPLVSDQAFLEPGQF